MKRYDIETIWDSQGERDVDIKISDSGDWVMYYDVVKYIANLEPKTLEVLAVECICADSVENLMDQWICPAHGYKRL